MGILDVFGEVWNGTGFDKSDDGEGAMHSRAEDLFDGANTRDGIEVNEL